jgi:hypothetical protein
MTKTADITETTPQQIVDQITALQPEEELLIVKKSVPLARVTPVKPQKKKLPFGCGRETNKILGPIDEPLMPEYPHVLSIQ